MTHLDAAYIKKRFPRIYTTCLRYDIDITKEMVPVSPAAHYMMGGIKTDLDGAASLKGLFAAGEVSCTGVHGANRLASNSLLEGLVYGYRAGSAAAGTSNQQIKSIPAYRLDHVTSAEAGKIEEIRSLVRRVMWEKTGIIRCEKSLNEAFVKLSDFLPYTRKRFDERSAVELSNMLTAAMFITCAALKRKGSVGAHYRSDFKAQGEGWNSHISIHRDMDMMPDMYRRE